MFADAPTIATGDEHDPEHQEEQDRLERRKRLNREAQRRFRNRRIQAQKHRSRPEQLDSSKAWLSSSEYLFPYLAPQGAANDFDLARDIDPPYLPSLDTGDVGYPTSFSCGMTQATCPLSPELLNSTPAPQEPVSQGLVPSSYPLIEPIGTQDYQTQHRNIPTQLYTESQELINYTLNPTNDATLKLEILSTSPHLTPTFLPAPSSASSHHAYTGPSEPTTYSSVSIANGNTSSSSSPSGSVRRHFPPHSRTPVDLEEPLFLAAENGHIGVIRALVEKGARLDAVDSEGNSALHLAIKGGHKGVVGYLLKQDVWQDSVNFDKLTPLNLAAQIGFEEGVRMLLGQ